MRTDAYGREYDASDVLDAEELADYRRYERPVTDQHAALARRGWSS